MEGGGVIDFYPVRTNVIYESLKKGRVETVLFRWDRESGELERAELLLAFLMYLILVIMITQHSLLYSINNDLVNLFVKIIIRVVSLLWL